MGYTLARPQIWRPSSWISTSGQIIKHFHFSPKEWLKSVKPLQFRLLHFYELWDRYSQFGGFHPGFPASDSIFLRSILHSVAGPGNPDTAVEFPFLSCLQAQIKVLPAWKPLSWATPFWYCLVVHYQANRKQLVRESVTTRYDYISMLPTSWDLCVKIVVAVWRWPSWFSTLRQFVQWSIIVRLNSVSNYLLHDA